MTLMSRRIVDNIFDNFVNDTSSVIRCDIYEKDNNYIIEADIPGFNKEDISVEINDDGYLTINALKRMENNVEEKNYLHRERSYGKYQRSFYVGDIDKVDASFDNGILKIVVSKIIKKNNKRIIEIK